MEWSRDDGYVVSDDSGRVDCGVVHRFLSRESYWAPNVPRAVVDRSIDNSLCLAVYAGSDMVAFARAVTDRATFAWLADVFVLPAHRRRGLASWLVEVARSHPDLQSLRTLLLGTRDAHALYARLGFQPLSPETAQRYMYVHSSAAELYGKERADE